jgi:deoxyribonuclease V
MRIPPAPHPWRLTPRQAVVVQRQLAARVSQEPPAATGRFIAGLDAALSADGKQCLAAVVLWDREAHAVVEQHTAPTFPACSPSARPQRSSPRCTGCTDDRMC